MRSRYGSSLKKTGGVQSLRGLRSRNITIFCAISKNKIEMYDYQTTAYNTFRFSAFIHEFINC